MKKMLLLLILIGVSQQVFSQQLLFKVGDKAPAINSITHSSTTFNLANATKKGPVVVLFYRGYWCPFCSKQLQTLQDSLYLLINKNATVVAITPEKKESVDKTIEKTKANFTIISDTTNQLLKAYGVNFTLDDKTIERYKGFGVDFEKINANNENILPVPAVYIIDEKGNFKFIWFNKDYRKRPFVKELLEHL
jgi:peroxiredoxin